ncbi:MAG TPA: cupin domain-containing protein [Micromonosporaceae bacterium]
MKPGFSTAEPPELPHDLIALLPQQGSFELQHDQPGKTHNWHHHSLDEELFVLDGEVTLFWTDDGTYREQHCPAGTWIQLPAGVVHGSTAGPRGAVYLIRPEGGATAKTVFLEPHEYPHPRRGD